MAVVKYLSLICLEGVPSLMTALKRRITQLMKDKENEVMTREQAKNWLTRNVSVVGNVIKAGTFRFDYFLSIVDT